MFGKKKQALPPFTLQVLTTEFLIDGTIAGDTSLYLTGQDTDIPPFQLTSVKIQTTGPAEIPIQTCAQFAVIGFNTVALIPRMDVTQMDLYEFWTLGKKPFLGVLHVGPYVMQGKLMLIAENHFERQTPIFDVRITSRVPGAHLSELIAPFALVNFHWLYGYEPL